MSRVVSASRLNRKESRDMLGAVVKEMLRVIDDRIFTAHAAGRNTTVIDLPATFSVDDICKADAQLIVYSQLLEIYGKPEASGGRGFDVRFRASGDIAQMQISWTNGLCEEEREKMQAIVKSYAFAK